MHPATTHPSILADACLAKYLSDAPGFAGADHRVKVMIVDDHEMLREAVSARLRAADFDVVSAVGTVSAARTAFESTHPALVIVDHSLPDGDGTDVVAAAREKCPDARVVMLSGHDDPTTIRTYIKARVDGYVSKSASSAEMVEVLQRVARGEFGFDARSSAQAVAALTLPDRDRTGSALSPRECQVLRLVADGATTEAIGSALNISPETVKTHVARMFAKLGTKDRASAVAAAMRRGILD